jgi:hypothetical protein
MIADRILTLKTYGMFRNLAVEFTRKRLAEYL